MTATGASSASRRMPGAVNAAAVQPARSGRRTRKRSSRSPPTTSPAALAPMINPHESAPPRSSRATAGPSTFVAPSCVAFKKAKPTTIPQSQVRALNSRQPAWRSARRFVVSTRAVRGSRISARTTPAARYVSGVEGERPPRARGRDEQAAGDRRRDLRHVQRQPQQGVRRLQQRARHGLRDDPGRRGEEERGRRARHELQRDQVPELGDAGQEQEGDRALCERADHVRRPP